MAQADRVVDVRISKKTREQAALLCAIAASNQEAGGLYGDIANQLGYPECAALLAYEAWYHVNPSRSDWSACLEARAESLLRTGWSP